MTAQVEVVSAYLALQGLTVSGVGAGNRWITARGSDSSSLQGAGLHHLTPVCDFVLCGLGGGSRCGRRSVPQVGVIIGNRWDESPPAAIQWGLSGVSRASGDVPSRASPLVDLGCTMYPVPQSQVARFLKSWQALLVAVVAAAGSIVVALLTRTDGPASAPSPTPTVSVTVHSSRLTIDKITFSSKAGEVLLDVAGSYRRQPGDGYLYAVAQPDAPSFGNSQTVWYVSDPPSIPDDTGHWVAHLDVGKVLQAMTVHAVLASGETQGFVSSAPLTASQVRSLLAIDGPAAGQFDLGPVPAAP